MLLLRLLLTVVLAPLPLPLRETVDEVMDASNKQADAALEFVVFCVTEENASARGVSDQCKRAQNKSATIKVQRGFTPRSERFTLVTALSCFVMIATSKTTLSPLGGVLERRNSLG